MIGDQITFWYIGQPVDEARIVDDDGIRYTEEELRSGVPIDLNPPQGHPVPKPVWSQKLGIRDGDKLHLAPFSKNVVFSIPSSVRTLRQLLQFINNKLNGKIQVHYRKEAWKRIQDFGDQRELRLKFADNTLVWFDLLGDDCAWAGNLHSMNGVWTYNVDS